MHKALNTKIIMVKKQTTQTERPRTALIVPREKFKSQLIERISLGKQLLNAYIKTEEQLKEQEKFFENWSSYNYELLKVSFNNANNDYKSSYNIAGQMIGVSQVMHGTSIHNLSFRFKMLKERVEAKTNALENILGKADILLSETESVTNIDNSHLTNVNDTVFIIHGHDEEMKRNVQLLLNRGKLNEIVLHEQPDKNRTVIEKLIEEGANASYVIALLSPDDTQNDGTSRARQNVILEIGYFLGKLGRERVRVLRKGDTVIPSDLQGILYENYDTDGTWKIKIAKEIKSTGLPIDMESIISKF